MSVNLGNAQRCKVCGEIFTATESGDLHRVIAETYDLVRDARGGIVRRHPGERQPGDAVQSLGNQRRRCLSAAEMVAAGMGRDSRGFWRRDRPGRQSPSHWLAGVAEAEGLAGETLGTGTPEGREALESLTAIPSAAILDARRELRGVAVEVECSECFHASGIRVALGAEAQVLRLECGHSEVVESVAAR